MPTIIGIIIFLFLNINSIISNIIIIPFQTYNPLITKNQKLLELIKNASDKDIIDTILRNLIYTNLDIGENKQTISTFIEMSSSEFYFRDLNMYNIIPYSKDKQNLNCTYNDNYLLNNIFMLNYYNSSLSKTYKYITTCPEYLKDFFLDRDVCGNDTIYLKHKNNIIDKEITKAFTFYITLKGFQKLDHRPGVIGLDIIESEFILKLKKYCEIKNYNWNIKYTNKLEEKGEFIIGDLSHIYDKDNYNENNLRSAKIIKQTKQEWSLNFDVFITKNEECFYSEKNEIGTFYIEEFFILGTKEYLKLIEDKFFNKYINEGVCQKQTHKKSEYGDYYFHFICYIKDKKKREQFLSIFPSLTFYQKEMDFNFTLDSNDLFTIIPDDNRILFNVEFNYGSDKWILGKPFFKKYQLNFNSDSKLISYYINLEREEIQIMKGNNNIKIIVIIFLVIIAFILGLLFGRMMCQKYNRKIRANELEDNYSYISKNINTRNNMKDISLKNENFISSYQIIQ